MVYYIIADRGSLPTTLYNHHKCIIIIYYLLLFYENYSHHQSALVRSHIIYIIYMYELYPSGIVYVCRIDTNSSLRPKCIQIFVFSHNQSTDVVKHITCTSQLTTCVSVPRLYTYIINILFYSHPYLHHTGTKLSKSISRTVIMTYYVK